MQNLFKQWLLLNAELIHFGAEQVQRLTGEFVKSATANDPDARKFVDRVEETVAGLERGAKGVVKGLKLDKLAERGAETPLGKQIQSLESQLKSMRQQKSNPTPPATAAAGGEGSHLDPV